MLFLEGEGIVLKNNYFASIRRGFLQRGGLYLSLLKAARSNTFTPIVSNLFLTGKCNYNCEYCYVGMDENPKRELSEQEWIKLISDLIKGGTKMFTLVGGEPLLSPHIDAIVDYLYSNNIYFMLTTNGSLISRRKDILSKIPQVTVSLDGDEQSHDDARQKGSHKKAMEGIILAKESGCSVRLNTVISKKNELQIDYLLDFCEKMDLYITFTPGINPPDFRKKYTDNWMLDDDGLRSFFVSLLKHASTSSRILNTKRSMEYMIGYPVSYHEVISRNDPHAAYYRERCPYGKIQFIYTNTGEVYPCGIWWNDPSFTPKNILRDGLATSQEHAHSLTCQACSFCNLVDWNELSKPAFLLRGLDITVHQLFGR